MAESFQHVKGMAGFDQLSSQDMLALLYQGQEQAVRAVKPALEDLANAVNTTMNRIGDKGRLVYVGAGTSGRLAVQDGVELGPTYGWPEDRTIYLMAGGEAAMMASVENAEDGLPDGQTAIAAKKIGENDIVILVAASGTTPYTLGALREAKKRGALTIGIVTTDKTPILSEADYGILANVGPETPSGSTRMKAGTAQKIMLNLFSTALMAKLGSVYDDLMVDMICSNAKLRRRAVNIVCKITNCTSETATKVLNATGFNIKISVLIALGQSEDAAKQVLAKSNNNLRQAIEKIKA